jgi:hypothetical protein
LAEDLPTALYVSALVALTVAVVVISLRRGDRTGAARGSTVRTLSHF